MPLPPGTLLNINVPGRDPEGVEVTRLGKRIYRDSLALEEEGDDGRRLYRIYGDAPGYHDEAGTDLAAVADGRIAVTPVHFDLTDRAGMDALRAARPRAPAAPGRPRGGVKGGGDEVGGGPGRRAPRGARPPQLSLLRPRRPRGRRRRLRRAARRAARARGRAPRAGHPRLAHAARRRGAGRVRSRRSATASRCSRWPTPARRRSCAPGSRGCATTWRARASRTRRSSSCASRRSTAWRSRSIYRDGVLERGATRGNGEIGEDVTHNLRTIRSIPLRIDDAPAADRGARRGLHVARRTSPRSTSAAPRPGCRRS